MTGREAPAAHFDGAKREPDSPQPSTGRTRPGEAGFPSRIDANPATVERGLAKLVLTVIELIRRLLEKQAIRRVEAGSLNEDEIERMGLTFMMLEQKLLELRGLFGLHEQDLNLDLGPLGELM